MVVLGQTFGVRSINGGVSVTMFSLDSPPNVRHSMHFWEPKILKGHNGFGPYLHTSRNNSSENVLQTRQLIA